MPIASLDDVKAHLNITSTTNDTELTSFLDVAVDLAQRYTGRDLGDPETVVETLDGTGTEALLLDRTPVSSVTSVVVNGSTWDATAYYVKAASGVLTAASGTWPAGRSNIVVTYAAGHDLIAPAARQAVLELTRHLWTTQRGSMPGLPRSTSGEDYNPGTGWSMPRRVLELLDPLRVTGVA